MAHSRGSGLTVCVVFAFFFVVVFNFQKFVCGNKRENSNEPTKKSNMTSILIKSDNIARLKILIITQTKTKSHAQLNVSAFLTAADNKFPCHRQKILAF